MQDPDSPDFDLTQPFDATTSGGEGVYEASGATQFHPETLVRCYECHATVTVAEATQAPYKDPLIDDDGSEVGLAVFYCPDDAWQAEAIFIDFFGHVLGPRAGKMHVYDSVNGLSAYFAPPGQVTVSTSIGGGRVLTGPGISLDMTPASERDKRLAAEHIVEENILWPRLTIGSTEAQAILQVEPGLAEALEEYLLAIHPTTR